MVTVFWPMNFLPSSVPKGSRKLHDVQVLASLLSLPTIVVLVEEFFAEVRTGKFCRRLGPVSRSGPGRCWSSPSLAVGPSAPRSMPESTLEKMELERMRWSVLADPDTDTPLRLLKAMVLDPAAVPSPTKVSDELAMFTPLPMFPMFPVPLAVVPTRLPSTLVPETPEMKTPSLRLPEMTLPAPAVVPPMVLLELRMLMPLEALPRFRLPLLSVPM